ncbi:hypothetical protein THAOC_34555 [Thalassiosira oceanica]|uniref:AMP-dependent synthetase/ligase domain-containing protein n=1 Tax=Thalassiosira oceanica TaxID=159749 RepID=K0RJC4_THAOC|nr:hypothetical protein THAOC_34555 [Thalassiosira oceanica]|eukprot:EJK46762.1 hypothetical protein THAOC_34555 [Thalassiosira oceanica]
MAPKLTQKQDGFTVMDYLLQHAETTPNRIFMTQPMGNGVVKTWTFGEFVSESKKMAAHIASMDIPATSQIAIMSKNCAWWLMADLAIMMTGHVGVPVYPTLTAETTKYTLKHSESKLLFVGKLDKKPWDEMKKGIPGGMKCISFPLCPDGLEHDTWEKCVGGKDELEEVKKRTPDEMATIIYTSGSTGVPKGVMVSYKAMTETVFGLIEITKTTSEDRYLSYLPISHGMERWVGQCVPFVTGMQVFYAEALGNATCASSPLRQFELILRPHNIQFQQGVFKKMPPQTLEKLLKIPLISYLVKRKLLQAMGLQDVRFAASGSAPLPVDLLAWYRSLGLELLEGYGMTEDFNYSHMSRPGSARVGYVGEPCVGVQQRIAEDGEMQVKSPGLMMGYFKNEEATEETMTEDGWLRTGDKGEIDDMGRFKITGRTKEIFKTSKGKYIAPAPIESRYISHPEIELACVGGRGQVAAHAIVLLGEDARKDAEAGKKDAIEKGLEKLMDDVNTALDDHEKVRFVAVVNEEWTPENGLVTPTNKIKRAKIEEEHAGVLDEWYGSKKKVIWHRW